MEVTDISVVLSDASSLFLPAPSVGTFSVKSTPQFSTSMMKCVPSILTSQHVLY